MKTMQSMHSVQIQSPQSAQAVYSPSSVSTMHTTSSLTAVDFTEEAVDAEACLANKERFSLIPGVEELVLMLDERESDESADLEMINERIVEEESEESEASKGPEKLSLRKELVEEVGGRTFSRRDLLSDWPFPAVPSSQSTHQSSHQKSSSVSSTDSSSSQRRPIAIRSASVSDDDYVYNSRLARRQTQVRGSSRTTEEQQPQPQPQPRQQLQRQQTRRHAKECPQSYKSPHSRAQRAQRARKRQSRRMSTCTKASSQFFPISDMPSIVPSAPQNPATNLTQTSYSLAVPLASPISAVPIPKTRAQKLSDDTTKSEERKGGKSYEEREPASPTVSRRRSAAVAMPNCIHELSKKFKRRPTFIGAAVFRRGTRSSQRSASTKHRPTVSTSSQIKTPALSPLIEDSKYMAAWPPAQRVMPTIKKENALFSR